MLFKCHLCNQNTIKRTTQAVSGRQFSSSPSRESTDQSPTLPWANTHGFAQTIPGNNPAESSVPLHCIKNPWGGTCHFPHFFTVTLISPQGTPGPLRASATGTPGPLHIPPPCLEHSPLLFRHVWLLLMPFLREPPQLFFTQLYLCFPGLLKVLLPRQALSTLREDASWKAPRPHADKPWRIYPNQISRLPIPVSAATWVLVDTNHPLQKYKK